MAEDSGEKIVKGYLSVAHTIRIKTLNLYCESMGR